MAYSVGKTEGDDEDDDLTDLDIYAKRSEFSIEIFMLITLKSNDFIIIIVIFD